MSLRTLVEAALVAVAGDVKAGTRTLVPPVGSYQPSSGITGTGTGSPTFGTQFWYPIDVGPVGWFADAFNFNVSAAYSGATIPTMFGGIYPTDPATGYPKTDTLLASASSVGTLSTTGMKIMTFASQVFLSPGRFWVSPLLSGPAVATAGTITCQTGTAIPFPVGAGTVPGTNIRALKRPVGSALQTTALLPSDFTLEGNVVAPIFNTRRAA